MFFIKPTNIIIKKKRIETLNTMSTSKNKIV